MSAGASKGAGQGGTPVSILQKRARIALVAAVCALAVISGVAVAVFAHPEVFGFLVIAAAIVLFMSLLSLLVSVVALVASFTPVMRSRGGATALWIVGLVCCGAAVMALISAALFLLPVFFP